MPTMSRFETPTCMEITIVHKAINKEFEFINEETGKHTRFIGIKVRGHKHGFSVSTKKYDVDGTSHRVKGKKGTLIIEIPRIKKKS